MGSPVWIQEKAHVSSFEPRLFKGAELAINLSPFTTNYVNIGKDYLAAGSYIDAKTAFDTAIGREPELFDAWLGRAYALEGLKRYQAAVESYDTAIQVSKSHKNSYYAYAGKGRSSLETQKFQDAYDACTVGIETYHQVKAENTDELKNMYSVLADAADHLGLATEAADARQMAEELRSKA